MAGRRRLEGRPWLLALCGNLLAAGLWHFIWLSGDRTSGRYLLAIALTMFGCLLTSVVLAVWQERAGLAAPFVLLGASLGALLFYREELTAQLPLAELIVVVVAGVAWFLATIGCQLRRRLRAMD